MVRKEREFVKKNIFVTSLFLGGIILLAGCSTTSAEQKPSVSPTQVASETPKPYLTKTVPSDPNILPSKDSVNNFTEKYCIPISEAATALAKGGNPDEISVQMKDYFVQATQMAKDTGALQDAQTFQQFVQYFKDGKIPDPFLKENFKYLQTLKKVDAISRLKCDLPLLPG